MSHLIKSVFDMFRAWYVSCDSSVIYEAYKRSAVTEQSLSRGSQCGMQEGLSPGNREIRMSIEEPATVWVILACIPRQNKAGRSLDGNKSGSVIREKPRKRHIFLSVGLNGYACEVSQKAS